MKGSNQSGEGKRIVWFSVFALLIALSPLLTKLCINGHDLEYHLLRIESLKEGILMGKPFLKVNVLFFGGDGYASSMFYPDFLLYIPALLRALGVSINASYHIFVGLCVILCYFSAFFCGYRITGSKDAALITGVILTLCNYHIEDLYVRAAVGEFTAFIFVPFVICGICNLLSEEGDRVYLLGIGYGGVLLCHTGTFILCLAFGLAAILYSLLYSLIAGKREASLKSGSGEDGGKELMFSGRAFVRLILTAAVTAGLTAFYWLPMLEQLLNDTFYVSRPWIDPLQEVRKFAGIFYSEFPSLGAILILIYLFRILAFQEESRKKEDTDITGSAKEKGGENSPARLLRFADMLFLFGVFFALCSTNFFPWKRLGHLMSFMQFPWRFFLMSSVCLAFADAILIHTLLAGYFEKHATLVTALVILCFALTSIRTMEVNSQGYYDYSDDYYSYKPFTANVIAGEWLPVSVKDRDLLLAQSEKAVGSDGAEVTFERIKNELTVKIDRKLSYVDVPFIYYRGYRAVLSPENGNGNGQGQKELSVDGNGENGLCRVYIEEGEEGQVRVYYGGTPWQKTAGLISLASLVIALLALISGRLRRGCKGEGNRKEGFAGSFSGAAKTLAGLILFTGLAVSLSGCAESEAPKARPDPESLKEIEDLIASRSGNAEKKQEEETSVSPVFKILINGPGFEPASNKSFTVTVEDSGGIPSEDFCFAVFKGEEEVFRGKLSERSQSSNMQYDSVPGDEKREEERYFYGDFTELTEPGTYYICCFAGDSRSQDSESFSIEKSYYSNRLTELILYLEQRSESDGQQAGGDGEYPDQRRAYIEAADLLLSYELFESRDIEAVGQLSVLPKSLEIAGRYLAAACERTEKAEERKEAEQEAGQEKEQEAGEEKEQKTEQEEEQEAGQEAEWKAVEEKYIISAVSSMYAFDIARFDQKTSKDYGKRAEKAFSEAEQERERLLQAGAEEAVSEQITEAERFWAAAQFYKYKKDKKIRRIAEELAVSCLEAEGIKGFFGGYPVYPGIIAYLTTTNEVEFALSEQLMNRILADAVQTAAEIKNGVYWKEDHPEEETSGLYESTTAEAFDQARLLIFANSVSQSITYIKAAEELYGYHTVQTDEKEPQMFILNGLIHSYVGEGSIVWPDS